MKSILVDDNTIDKACVSIREADLIAVDTEFHAERRYIPELYLVQVHIPDGDTWIIDGKSKGLLKQIGPSMCATNWLVHGGEQDMLLLNREFGGLPDEVFDTQVAAGLCSKQHYPASLGNLLSTYLQVSIPKQATLSDWSRRPLSKEQIDYAVEDVLLLPNLWSKMMTIIDHNDRREALGLACQELRLRILCPPPLDLKWTSIGGAKKLQRQQLAVLQELSAWREELAIQHNQPPRSIVSDNLLCQFSRSQPSDTESMKNNRRMPKAVIKKYGEAIVERVQRASSRPAWAWPNYVTRDTKAERTAQFLLSASMALSTQHDTAANLILPSSIITRLSVSNIETREELRQLLGWRDSLVGEPIWSILKGELCLVLKADGPILETRHDI